ncbi:MAG: RNA-binding protein [Legionellales bacterium]|nr:RNA-binding protein [Legionellales bacterium]
MTNKIYVGNLPYQLDESALQAAFAQFGEIIDVKVVKDRDTGESRGFGFITFSNRDEARNSLVMGGQMLENRKLFVKFARERQQQRSHDMAY